MKYVQQVRGRWVARMTVPDELRPILNLRELVEPLDGDKRQAERQALGVLNRFHATIDEAREAYMAGLPTLSSAAKHHYRAEMEADDRAREHGDPDPDFARLSRSRYAQRLRRAVADEVERDEIEALIGYAADTLGQKGLLPDVPRPALLRALAEVQLEALARFEERDAGRVALADPKHPLLTAPDPQPLTTPQPAPEGGLTLSKLLEAFHAERGAGGRTLAPKTMEEHKVAVRMLTEYLGGDVPVRSITKAQMIGYKQALLKTPTRYAQRFPGLNLPQAIKANAKRAEPFETLDPQTINMKWLSHLSSLMQWGEKNDYLATNPAKGVRVDTGADAHRERSRVPFDAGDLKRIFGNPLFADPATYATKQWALLLALYTGARSSSELARLRVADLTTEQGVPVLYLSGASKNAHSVRHVPLHRDLIDMGFPAYVKRMKDKGADLLFPDWQPEDRINRWFLRTYLPAIGITDKRKVLHSFRHLLKTALARSGCSRELSDLLTGHKDQTVAAQYVHAAPLVRMKEALDEVTFDLPMI